MRKQYAQIWECELYHVLFMYATDQFEVESVGYLGCAVATLQKRSICVRLNRIDMLYQENLLAFILKRKLFRLFAPPTFLHTSLLRFSCSLYFCR